MDQHPTGDSHSSTLWRGERKLKQRIGFWKIDNFSGTSFIRNTGSFSELCFSLSVGDSMRCFLVFTEKNVVSLIHTFSRSLCFVVSGISSQALGYTIKHSEKSRKEASFGKLSIFRSFQVMWTAAGVFERRSESNWRFRKFEQACRGKRWNLWMTEDLIKVLQEIFCSSEMNDLTTSLGWPNWRSNFSTAWLLCWEKVFSGWAMNREFSGMKEDAGWLELCWKLIRKSGFSCCLRNLRCC